MRITIKNLKKSFGTAVVTNMEELTFEQGKITTMLGPSGSGKTTLLRMIAGLETPDYGEIWFDEQCVFSSEQKIDLSPDKRELGFVFQDFALWPHLTVFENVAFGLRARKQKEQLNERVMQALETVQLAGFESRYPHQLSGGQQQRVAFARAIVVEPNCLLFDEPMSALDAVLRNEMRIELRNLVNQIGITAIFVTHDQVDAMSMSDEVIVLNEGFLQQKGTPEEIYNRPENEFVARFIGRSNWLDTKQMFRPESVSLTPDPLAEKYQVSVISSQFIGQGYELCLEKDDQRWYAVSTQKPQTTNLDIYVKKEHILQII